MIYDPWPCEDAGHCLADQIRARLAEVEAERDIGIAEVEAQRDKALADLTEMTAGYTTQMETISGLLPRLREIEARLAEVEAALLQGGQTAQIRCNAALLALDGWTTKPPSAAAGDRAEQMIADVKREHAAAWRDEVRPNLGPVAGGTAGDRAEAEPVYPFGTPCRFAGTGCGEDYCTCAETVGHFCPIECVTCGAAGDDLGFSGLCPTCRGIGRHLDTCNADRNTERAGDDRG